MKTGTIVGIVLAATLVGVTVLTVSLGYFDKWLFIGSIFLGVFYLVGYLYIVNSFEELAAARQAEAERKRKFDWCWERANARLRKMAGGQGLEWKAGVGRRSEVRHYHDGIQYRAYRSMMGHISHTQQLAILIYDIDNDDVVRYYADPSTDVIADHFYGFKPFANRGYAPGNPSAFGYPGRGMIDPRKGVTVSVNDGAYGNFDNAPKDYTPPDEMVGAAVKKIGDRR